ncbi:hypothetical protein [Chenggangzhangella methanolivorans]|uniref:Uncharacterized protein n=1 Tax=Chenggangzhangella methanolivorans TaxID=1437009 RepID=A0A9E6RAG5_9HYPH|nr:hypothetical protein [Chenggangzhangella methanolivorans]QZO01178.1 hypothetical protein K6K41_06425 [Chenggangzhangella methanolivorans]
MSAIQDCLSRFTVAVWSQSPNAVQDIDAAITAYLATQAPDRTSQIQALATLRDCYGRVTTSSPLSETVRATIDERLAALTPAAAAA